MSCNRAAVSSQKYTSNVFGCEDDDVSVAETLSSIGKAVLPDYMLMANRLMKEMSQKRRIRNSDDFAANFFVPLYETITGRLVKDAVRDPKCSKETYRNLELLLNQLSCDLQNTSLSHIRAEDLLTGDTVAICNLLEILQGLTEYTIKKGHPLNKEHGDDENLSTFRSQASSFCPQDDLNDDWSDKPNSQRKQYDHGFSSGNLPLSSQLSHGCGFAGGDYKSQKRVVSNPIPPDTDLRRPLVIETASTGSSVSVLTNDEEFNGLPVANFKDTQNYGRMRKQMIRAEKRAERVGLIAQLLANCALLDRLNARSGRRVLRDLSLDDNSSEVSDIVPSIDDDRTDDTFSIGESTLCDPNEELPGMSLSNAALRRLQKCISPMLSESPTPRSTDQVEKHRVAAERRVIAEAKRREHILSRMVRREISTEKRLRELAEHRAADAKLRADERNFRLSNARANRYGEQLMRELKGLQMKVDHKTEEVMREALTEGGRIERHQRLALERQIRDEKSKQASIIKDEVESMENFYHDQICELTESAKDEKESIEIEANAKRMQTSHVKQELRMKLESDIRKFQQSLRTDTDDAAFFRRLDAQRALDKRHRSFRSK